MSQQPARRRQPQRGQRRPRRPAPDESLFRAVPAPDELPTIEPVARPTAFIQSLDAMPLRGTHFIEQYVAAVVERAAGFAIALAAAAELDTSPVVRDADDGDESGGAEPSD